MTEYSQHEMIHKLPHAEMVDRFAYLRDLCAGRRVIHVGFVDMGCAQLNTQSGVWLHEHLDRTARELVGIDLDTAGVENAKERGYEAYAIDACDAAAVAAAGIAPAEVVVAGEVIEHLDDPGSFLQGVHNLVAPGGILVVTTPNAAGLFNSIAVLGNMEVNHPDHVVLFTCRTLDAMLMRHGWEPFEHRVYVQEVKSPGTTTRDKVMAGGAKAILGMEKLLARLGRPFAADGMIVVARRPAAGAE